MKLQVARRALIADPLSIDGLRFEDVDIIVAASGYEPRCTHLVSRLISQWRCDPQEFGRKLVLLEFASQQDIETRRQADAFFLNLEPLWRLKVAKESGYEVHLTVESALATLQGGAAHRRIVIDYSAMSRMLYLSLLQLAAAGHELLFSYSIGEYGEAAERYPISAVGAVQSVPGFEGLAYHSRPHLHVFGLGYDGVGTLALSDRLEAQRVIVFWAEPGVTAAASGIAKDRNSRLIERAAAHFCRDIRDVRGVVSVLSQIAFETSVSDKLVFVPVGPKPHILACAIVAARFEHVTLLAPYLGAGGIRSKFPEIQATGEVIISRVQAVPEE